MYLPRFQLDALPVLMVAALAVTVFAQSASAQQPVTSKILVQEFDDEASKALAATFEFLAFGVNFDNGEAFSGGSSALVRSNSIDGAWVLTAGHAILAPGPNKTVAYGFSPDMFTAFADQDYIFADLVIGHPSQDIALVRLESRPLRQNGSVIEPIEFSNGALVRDMTVLFAGYGEHGIPGEAGPAGTGNWDGFARAARGRFDRSYVLDRSIYLLEYESNIQLSGIVAPHDSGGFAAVEDETGKPLMVGVNKMILGTGETAVTGIEYLRYDPNFFTWLEDTIAANRPDGSEGEGEDNIHAADRNSDGSISLSELLRVIQFFNSSGYHCADEASPTEDGFAPGADSGKQACAPHDSDYNPRDWALNLSELLRAIQFFNTGGYRVCPEGEDGYCPGAAASG